MQTTGPTNWEMFKRGFVAGGPIKMFFSWEMVCLANIELLRQQAYEDRFLLEKKYEGQFADTSEEEKKILHDFADACRLDFADTNPVAWEKALSQLEEDGLEHFRLPRAHWAYGLGAFLGHITSLCVIPLLLFLVVKWFIR
jgi:hypothetical protein